MIPHRPRGWRYPRCGRAGARRGCLPSRAGRRPRRDNTPRARPRSWAGCARRPLLGGRHHPAVAPGAAAVRGDPGGEDEPTQHGDGLVVGAVGQDQHAAANLAPLEHGAAAREQRAVLADGLARDRRLVGAAAAAASKPMMRRSRASLPRCSSQRKRGSSRGAGPPARRRPRRRRSGCRQGWRACRRGHAADLDVGQAESLEGVLDRRRPRQPPLDRQRAGGRRPGRTAARPLFSSTRTRIMRWTSNDSAATCIAIAGRRAGNPGHQTTSADPLPAVRLTSRPAPR